MIPAREMMLAQLGTKAADAIVRNPQMDRMQLAVTTFFAPKRFTSGEAGIQNRFLLFYRKIKTKRFIISHATIVIIPIQKNFDDFVAFSSFTSIL